MKAEAGSMLLKILYVVSKCGEELADHVLFLYDSVEKTIINIQCPVNKTLRLPNLSMERVYKENRQFLFIRSLITV